MPHEAYHCGGFQKRLRSEVRAAWPFSTGCVTQGCRAPATLQRTLDMAEPSTAFETRPVLPASGGYERESHPKEVTRDASLRQRLRSDEHANIGCSEEQGDRAEQNVDQCRKSILHSVSAECGIGAECEREEADARDECGRNEVERV